MRRVWTRGIAVLALGVLVTGCATIRPREGFEDVSRLVGERTGQRVYWNQGTAEDSAVAHTVRTLLSDSLAVEQAVQIALLGNRRIQAVYEDLGIAQAELVQAGLLGNPVFSVRGLGHGDGLGVLKYGIAQPFVDLFQIPLRKRVAGAAYESAKHRVASAVFDLAADTRISYYRLQGALQLVELRQSVARALAASAAAARELHTVGNLANLDLATERAQAEQARVDLAVAEAEVATAREELALLMGLSAADTTWTIAGRLPPVPELEPSGVELIEMAITHRLDLAASAHEVNVAAQALGLDRTFALLPDGSIGWEWEGGRSEPWARGPGASVTVPLFDRGRARVGRARGVLRQAVARHDALAAAIRSQVQTTYIRLLAARSRAELYRTVIVPLRHQVVEETLLHYNAMALGVFVLLQAKQGEIEAGRTLVEAQRDYWVIRAELERAVGTKLPEGEVVVPQTPEVDELLDAGADGPASGGGHQHHHGAQDDLHGASGPDSKKPHDGGQIPPRSNKELT